ncbi:hypothetical protein KP509_31G059400 [Ceratopteris richardii]|uniref:Uncharacterized protein n=1 Tax=Ceratopteris richardii TaxID=49495 RepID=A0A8T2R0B7_CERRI|nr:hypothetical protein KP509_31G059400 [Ceratopteris richardii]
MVETLSWVAVDENGEICIDEQQFYLPQSGWERSLDIKSGVMYLKRMTREECAPSLRSNTGERGQKRRKALNGEHGENVHLGLQLTLSILKSNETGCSHHISAAISPETTAVRKISSTTAENTADTMEGIEENRSMRASGAVQNSLRLRSVIVDAGIPKEQSASSNLRRDHGFRQVMDSCSWLSTLLHVRVAL